MCKALPHKQKAQDVTHLQHAKWRHTLTGRLTPTAKAMCRASTKLLYPLIPYTHKKEALSLNSIDVKASGPCCVLEIVHLQAPGATACVPESNIPARQHCCQSWHLWGWGLSVPLKTHAIAWLSLSSQPA